MNVILLERLNNLGDLGDEVSVKPGFARNYLIPQQKAVQANAANREVFEARRAELEKNANDKLGIAQSRAEKLHEHIVTIMMKSGEEGRLYGSVGTQNIADALVMTWSAAKCVCPRALFVHWVNMTSRCSCIQMSWSTLRLQWLRNSPPRYCYRAEKKRV